MHSKYYLIAMQIPTHFYLGGKKVSTALWAGLIEPNCSAQASVGFLAHGFRFTFVFVSVESAPQPGTLRISPL